MSSANASAAFALNLRASSSSAQNIMNNNNKKKSSSSSNTNGANPSAAFNVSSASLSSKVAKKPSHLPFSSFPTRRGASMPPSSSSAAMVGASSSSSSPHISPPFVSAAGGAAASSSLALLQNSSGARAVYWSSVLSLPNSDNAYATINLRRASDAKATVAFKDSADLLKSDRMARGVKRLWSALTTMEPALEQFPFLPFMCIAVAGRSLPTSPMQAFETSLHLLGNVLAPWMLHYPAPISSLSSPSLPADHHLPPTHLLVLLDDALRVSEIKCQEQKKTINTFPTATFAASRSLWDHLNYTCGASANDYFWLPLQTFFLYNFAFPSPSSSAARGGGGDGSAAAAFRLSEEGSESGLGAMMESSWQEIFDSIVVPTIAAPLASSSSSLLAAASPFAIANGAHQRRGLSPKSMFSSWLAADPLSSDALAAAAGGGGFSVGDKLCSMASASQRTLYAVALAMVLMKKSALLRCRTREDVHAVMTRSIFHPREAAPSRATPNLQQDEQQITAAAAAAVGSVEAEASPPRQQQQHSSSFILSEDFIKSQMKKLRDLTVFVGEHILCPAKGKPPIVVAAGIIANTNDAASPPPSFNSTSFMAYTRVIPSSFFASSSASADPSAQLLHTQEDVHTAVATRLYQSTPNAYHYNLLHVAGGSLAAASAAQSASPLPLQMMISDGVASPATSSVLLGGAAASGSSSRYNKYPTLEAIERSEEEMFRSLRNELETLEMLRGVKDYFGGSEVVGQQQQCAPHTHSDGNNNANYTMTNHKLFAEYEALKQKVMVASGAAAGHHYHREQNAPSHHQNTRHNHLGVGVHTSSSSSRNVKSVPSAMAVPDEPTLAHVSKINPPTAGVDADDTVLTAAAVNEGPSSAALPQQPRAQHPQSRHSDPHQQQQATSAGEAANASVVPDSIIEAVSLLMRAQQRRERQTQPHERMRAHSVVAAVGSGSAVSPAASSTATAAYMYAPREQEPYHQGEGDRRVGGSAAQPYPQSVATAAAAAAAHYAPAAADASGIVNSRTASGYFGTATAANDIAAPTVSPSAAAAARALYGGGGEYGTTAAAAVPFPSHVHQPPSVGTLGAQRSSSFGVGRSGMVDTPLPLAPATPTHVPPPLPPPSSSATMARRSPSGGDVFVRASSSESRRGAEGGAEDPKVSPPRPQVASTLSSYSAFRNTQQQQQPYRASSVGVASSLGPTTNNGTVVSSANSAATNAYGNGQQPKSILKR